MTEDPIDYSRPVGWWCPVCHMQWPQYPNTLIRQHQHAVIPVFEPIPEGQRPPAASEVEEAEVVTVRGDFGNWAVWSMGHTGDWPHASDWREDADVINRIAQASARARIVTGATE